MLRMRVLVVAPNPTDGTAWWRIVSPLGMMGEQFGGNFEWNIFAQADHVQISKCDLLFLQRPVRPEDVAYMNIAKRLGIPVVVEYDDDYTNVPPNNPRMMVYMQQDVQARVRELLTGADLIVTSTHALKKRWQSLNKRIAVVPNAWDDRIQLDRGPERLPGLNVMWRGGDSHNEDLSVFGDAIVQAAWEGPPAIFHFAGHGVYHIHDRMPPAGITEHPFTDLMSYFHLLGQLRPDILIVPLCDTPFNHAKSNIALLEGSFAGAAVLAPDWPDWQCEGVTHYKNPIDFGHKLISLMKRTRAERKDMATKAWDAVRDRMLVSRANGLRTVLFSKLVDEFRAKRWKPTGKERDMLKDVLQAAAAPEPVPVVRDAEGNIIPPAPGIPLLPETISGDAPATSETTFINEPQGDDNGRSEATERSDGTGRECDAERPAVEREATAT